MKINKSNGLIINSKEIYIHDDILIDLHFIRAEKLLSLLLSTEDEKNTYTIDFIDVIGFEMSSCDFWGPSPHIYGFAYMQPEEYMVIPKLKENEYFSSAISPEKAEDYIETKIIFTSGDELIIACKSIEYNKS